MTSMSDAELCALPPRGRCRGFLRTVSQDNLEADVILGAGHVVKLRDLLASYGWSSQLLWRGRRDPQGSGTEADPRHVSGTGDVTVGPGGVLSPAISR